MSDMVANKGKVIEIYPELKTIREKLQAFADQQMIPLDDIIYDSEDDSEIELKNYEEDLMIVGNRLFDMSNAATESDVDGFREYMQKVGENEYEVDFYYYNGGTCFDELFRDHLDRADKEYLAGEEKTTFYAIKFKDGRYWARGSNASPSTFSTEGRARGTANNSSVGLDPDTYDIVKLVEQ